MSKITNRQNLKLEAGNYCLEQVRVPHSGGHKEEGEGEHQVVRHDGVLYPLCIIGSK